MGGPGMMPPGQQPPVYGGPMYAPQQPVPGYPAAGMPMPPMDQQPQTAGVMPEPKSTGDDQVQDSFPAGGPQDQPGDTSEDFEERLNRLKQK